MIIVTNSLHVKNLAEKNEEKFKDYFKKLLNFDDVNITLQYKEDLDDLSEGTDIFIYKDHKIPKDKNKSVESLFQYYESVLSLLSTNPSSYNYKESDILFELGLIESNDYDKSIIFWHYMKGLPSNKSTFNKLDLLSHSLPTLTKKYLEKLISYDNEEKSNEVISYIPNVDIEKKSNVLKSDLYCLQEYAFDLESKLENRLNENLFLNEKNSLMKKENLDLKNKVSWFRTKEAGFQESLVLTKEKINGLTKANEEITGKNNNLIKELNVINKKYDEINFELNKIKEKNNSLNKKVNQLQDEKSIYEKVKQHNQKLIKKADLLNRNVSVLAQVINKIEGERKSEKLNFSSIKRTKNIESDARLINEHSLFNTALVRKQIDELGINTSNIVEFYLKYGDLLGVIPSASFDSNAYLNLYQDVKESGMNSLLHYVKFGKAEGRRVPTKMLAVSK